MLRFILTRRQQDHGFGTEFKYYFTLDIDVPELEEALTRGGSDETRYDESTLIGVEVLQCDKKAKE